MHRPPHPHALHPCPSNPEVFKPQLSTHTLTCSRVRRLMMYASSSTVCEGSAYSRDRSSDRPIAASGVSNRREAGEGRDGVLLQPTQLQVHVLASDSGQGQRKKSWQRVGATSHSREQRAAAVWHCLVGSVLTGAVGDRGSMQQAVMPHGALPCSLRLLCAVCSASPFGNAGCLCTTSLTLQRPSQRQQRRQVGRRVPLQAAGGQGPQRATGSSTHTHTNIARQRMPRAQCS